MVAIARYVIEAIDLPEADPVLDRIGHRGDGARRPGPGRRRRPGRGARSWTGCLLRRHGPARRGPGGAGDDDGRRQPADDGTDRRRPLTGTTPGARCRRRRPRPPPTRATVHGHAAGFVTRAIGATVDACAVVLAVAIGYVVVAGFRFLLHPRSFQFPAPGFAVILLVVGRRARGLPDRDLGDPGAHLRRPAHGPARRRPARATGCTGPGPRRGPSSTSCSRSGSAGCCSAGATARSRTSSCARPSSTTESRARLTLRR